MNWEYIYLSGTAPEIKDGAYNLGRQRWEMVNLVVGKFGDYIAFFKRELLDV